MKLHTIDTGYFKLDGGAMFGVVPKTLWTRYKTPDSNNLVTWAMRCLLIESSDRLILIDCGIGDKQDAKWRSFFEPHGDDSLQASLKRLGFGLDEITDVILTHLHFDHCGGAVRLDSEGKPHCTFPNARYWSHQDHWNWAMKPNAREKASFLKENFEPIQASGQLNFLDAETRLIPEMEFFFANGHTEQMTIPKIRYKDRTIVYMADLLPSPFHMPIPWVMSYDVRPLVTLDEKSTFLQEAMANDYILYFEHDDSIEACNLTDKNGRVSMDAPLLISEL